MLALALGLLAEIASVLAENDGEYAKGIVAKALRILGGAESDETKHARLSAYIEFLAMERASAATTALMARSKHD